MTSTNKIESNQRNAQLSTGPRTPEGKARVAGNPVTHGLRGRHTVLITENPHEFAQLCDDFFAEWQPLNHTEADLVEQLCVTKWKLARMERVESHACMLSALVHLALRPELSHATPNLDAKSEKAAAERLNRVSQHIARLERAYFRALDVLTRMQERRLKKFPKQTGYVRPVPQPEPEPEVAAAASSTPAPAAAPATKPILLPRTRFGQSPLHPSGLPDGN